MHKDDKMTPKERAAALKEGKAVDRLPIGMLYGLPAAALMGWSRSYGDSTPRRRADCTKKVYEVFGTDGVGSGYGLHGVGICYGAKMSDPEYSAPAVLEHPVKSVADIVKLDIGRLTVQNDRGARECMEIAEILNDELGDEVPCRFMLPGAFTSISSLVGVETLLRALAHDPDSLHLAMEFVTNGLLQLARSFLEAGFPISIADPVASGSVIPKRQFDAFVAPYNTRFVEECNSIRPFGVTCHICGNTTKILESIAACGYMSVDVDNTVDLEYAKNHIGNTVRISGNVNPAGNLFFGEPEQVEEEVKKCFRIAWDSPCGYTVSTGCDTAWGTPIENSLAFMRAARKCAQYPIDPQNFR